MNRVHVEPDDSIAHLNTESLVRFSNYILTNLTNRTAWWKWLRHRELTIRLSRDVGGQDSDVIIRPTVCASLLKSGFNQPDVVSVVADVDFPLAISRIAGTLDPGLGPVFESLDNPQLADVWAKTLGRTALTVMAQTDEEPSAPTAGDIADADCIGASVTTVTQHLEPFTIQYVGNAIIGVYTRAKRSA